ncbi:competence ComEA-like helix-hairpin-helix protein [Pedobacter sp. CAN_A7]|uniref:ComEA family DNA-binding protein n=1 Tax=Pedobacter sp. CAN_A7 TaxID=2787722 RepID=UPI0018CA5D0B
MRKWLRNYFDLTKGEFNGLLVLVLLIFGVSCLPTLYNWLWPVTIDPGMEQMAEAHYRQLMRDQPQASAFGAAKRTFSTAKSVKPPLRLHRFDPNTTDLRGWQDLGFSVKQAQSILNYRLKGGQFRKPEDLQKMYVVSAAAYQKLRPYIDIEPQSSALSSFKANDHQEKPRQQVFNYPKDLPVNIRVEINQADTAALETIRGIGPAFAKRIIQYRERIGGFHKKEQLMEVYGLDLVKFEEIKDQVVVDASLVKRLNVNTIRVEDFKNNPYIRYKQANAIIQYREQHGNYSTFDDLKKVIILSPQVLEQLSPYISFVP